MFVHRHGLTLFPYHLCVLVDVIVGCLDDIIKGGELTAIFLQKFLGISFLLKSPFCPLRHDSHLAAAYDPERLLSIDQVLCAVISYPQGLGRFVDVQDEIDGRAMNAAGPFGRPVSYSMSIRL